MKQFLLPLWLTSLVFLAACHSDRAEHAAKPAAHAAAAPAAVPTLQFAEVAAQGETVGVQAYPRRDSPARMNLRAPRSFQLKSVRSSTDNLGRPAIAFEIADAQKDEFRIWTGTLVDHQLAILVGGQVLTAPRVVSALPGHGVIESGAEPWTAEEVDALLSRIQGK